MSSKSVQDHNKAVLQTLEPGDGVEFNRWIYSHWGLYVGSGQVVHLTGDLIQSTNWMMYSGTTSKKAFVKKEDFFKVAGNFNARKNNKKDRRLPVRSADKMIATAMSMFGEIGYNVLWRNCEHFVSYCRHGVWESDQVEEGLLAAAALALGEVLVVILLRFMKKKYGVPAV